MSSQAAVLAGLQLLAGGVIATCLFGVWLHAHLNTLIYQEGHWDRARWWLRLSRYLLPEGTRRLHELSTAEFSGETKLALDLAERIVSGPHRLIELNSAMTALINAGRYARALELAIPWATPRPDAPAHVWALFQVNAAEAEYNLGRWNESLARLERIDATSLVSIARAGHGQQRAWILAHLGRVDEAATAIDSVDPRELPAVFHAEYLFTKARVAFCAGALEDARRSCEAGLARGRRLSSMRNGLFLRARIDAAAGDAMAALAGFEAAAAMPYRAQGGDGLLAWGDLLHSRGRTAEARSAWQLERCPEILKARRRETHPSV